MTKIEREVETYSQALAGRDIWTIVTKTDTASPDDVRAVSQKLRALRPERPIFEISAVARQGVRALTFALMEAVENQSNLDDEASSAVNQDVLNEILSRTKPRRSADAEEEDEVEVIYRRD